MLPPIAFPRALLYSLLLAAIPARFFGTDSNPQAWRPFEATLLEQTQCEFDPEAGAEYLFALTEIDDTALPRRRFERIHKRIKIYDVLKAEPLLRLSIEFEDEKQEIAYLEAKLHYPDGSIVELGPADFMERELASIRGFSNARLLEKFIVFPNVVDGTVIEYRYSIENEGRRDPSRDFRFQESYPIREMQLSVIGSPETGYYNRISLFDPEGLTELQNDAERKHTVVTGTKLPAVKNEPLSGPGNDTSIWALVEFLPEAQQMQDLLEAEDNAYEKKAAEQQGRWGLFSVWNFWRQEEAGKVTKKLVQATEEITSNASNDAERIANIFTHCRSLYQVNDDKPKTTGRRGLKAVSDLLGDAGKNRRFYRRDYHYLLRGMLEAAGFEARMAMLPNIANGLLYRSTPSLYFLPKEAVAVKVGGQWIMLDVSEEQRPFPMINWRHEGQVALLANQEGEQFVEVPLTNAEANSSAIQGSFRLNEFGELSGKVQYILTGHHAAQMRQGLSDKKEEDYNKSLLEGLRDRLPEGFIAEDLQAVGIDDPDAPVQITVKIQHETYALALGDRFFLPLSVFEKDEKATFTDDTRVHPIRWDFEERLYRRYIFYLPEGYRPASTEAPESKPGPRLSFTNKIAYDEKTNSLLYESETIRRLVMLPPEHYPVFREWYDHLQLAKQFELLLNRTE